MSKLLIILLVLIIIFSCSSNREAGKIIQNYKNVYIENTEVFEDKLINFDSLFFGYDFTILETNPEKNIIGSIDQIWFYKNLIIAVDHKISKGVFIFDRLGKLVSSIQNTGRGPGEYIKIETVNFNAHKQIIEIFDSERQKILFFDLNSKFIKSIPSPVNFDTFVYDEVTRQYFFYCKFFPNKAGKYRLISTDSNFHIKHKYLSYSEHLTGARIVSMDNNFYTSSNGTYFCEPYADFIYKLEDGYIQQDLRIQFSKNRLPENFIDNKTTNKAQVVSDKNYTHLRRSFICENDFRYFQFSYNGILDKFIDYKKLNLNNIYFSGVLHTNDIFYVQNIVDFNEETSTVTFLIQDPAGNSDWVKQMNQESKLKKAINSVYSKGNHINAILISCRLPESVKDN